jgi:hypothetical protein
MFIWRWVLFTFCLKQTRMQTDAKITVTDYIHGTDDHILADAGQVAQQSNTRWGTLQLPRVHRHHTIQMHLCWYTPP